MQFLHYTLPLFSVLLYSYKYFSKEQKLLWFVLYLLFSSIIDIIAYYIYSKGGYTVGGYNILVLLEFNFLLLFYKAISEERITKKIISLGLLLFNLVYLFSSVYIGNRIFYDVYNMFSNITGSLILSVILVFYLREFLLSNKILNYKRNNYFWITTGLLFYYLGTLPVLTIIKMLKSQEDKDVLAVIQSSLTIVMHLSFIIGFVWSKKEVK